MSTRMTIGTWFSRSCHSPELLTDSEVRFRLGRGEDSGRRLREEEGDKGGSLREEYMSSSQEDSRGSKETLEHSITISWTS